MKDKCISVELENYLLFDGINNLAIEYSTSVNYLVNAAIKRLIDDVEFMRKLRNISTHHPNEQK